MPRGFQKGHISWNKGLKTGISGMRGKKLTQLEKDERRDWCIEHNHRPPKVLPGKDNPNWKGGITSLRGRIQKSKKYQKWRTFCLKRDKSQCIFGNKEHDNNLQVDHIVPFSYIMKKNGIKTFEQAMDCKELWDINNGRTLCINCHKQTDTYMEKVHTYGK